MQPVRLIGSQRTRHAGGRTCADARSRPSPAARPTPVSAIPVARVTNPRRVIGSATGPPGSDPDALRAAHQRLDVGAA